LWWCFRPKRFAGSKFRRQHRIGPYFADFCCIERRLIMVVAAYRRWVGDLPLALELGCRRATKQKTHLTSISSMSSPGSQLNSSASQPARSLRRCRLCLLDSGDALLVCSAIWERTEDNTANVAWHRRPSERWMKMRSATISANPTSSPTRAAPNARTRNQIEEHLKTLRGKYDLFHAIFSMP
jgi:Protein of unknown function (DUF559)